MFRTIRARRLRTLVFPLLLAAAGSSCSLEKQAAPGLTGPSEFSTSLTLTATPDRLVRDGETQSVITATVRDAQGNPRPGVALQWSASTSDGSLVTLSEASSVTDSAGRASIGVSAPAPSVRPAQDPTATISATPAGNDFAAAVSRSVVLQLDTPTTIPTANRNPVPSFTVTPVAPSVGQGVEFNASSTTDEGQACGTRCAYRWTFGNGRNDSGMVVSHTYTTTGNMTVTLTVTDDRGAVASTSQTVAVAGTALTADFVVSPSSPRVNQSVNFDASTSTMGPGITVVEYEWNFGNGTVVTTTTPRTSHTYTTAATYRVVLRIRDNIGRTAVDTADVTIAP